MPQTVAIEKLEKRAISVVFMKRGDAPGKLNVEMRSQLHGHGGGAMPPLECTSAAARSNTRLAYVLSIRTRSGSVGPYQSGEAWYRSSSPLWDGTAGWN